MLPAHMFLQSLANGLTSRNVMASSMLGLSLLFCAAYSSASALGAIRNPADELLLSVNTRTNPAYDPQGIRAADFVFSPAITAGTRYNDNVYATDRNEKSDLIHRLTTRLAANSDFIRHRINFSIEAERGIHQKETQENYTDYKASVSGQIDVSGQTTIPLLLNYERNHIKRGSPDDLIALSPTEYDLWTASSGLVHAGRSFMVKILATLRDYNYSDGRSSSGALVRHSDRDRSEKSLYASIGLPEEGYFAPFVYGEVTDIDYDTGSDLNGLNRNSKGYEIGAGSIVNVSRMTKTSFHAGYVQRKTEDARLSDTGHLTYGVNIVWEPSTLASFTLSGHRRFNETLQSGSPGRIESNIGLSMNYEIFPNLFLRPAVNYTISDYEGIDREVEHISGEIGSTYKMNQNLWLSGSYRYITQEETGSRQNQRDFENNVFDLSLKLQF